MSEAEVYIKERQVFKPDARERLLRVLGARSGCSPLALARQGKCNVRFSFVSVVSFVFLFLRVLRVLCG
jgi:hypothetical protein